MAFIRITVLELFFWGNGSRPVRWSAMQVLLASYSGASTWMVRFSDSFS